MVRVWYSQERRAARPQLGTGKKELDPGKGGQDLGNRERDPSSPLHRKIWFEWGQHAAYDPLMDDSCGCSENFCLSPSSESCTHRWATRKRKVVTDPTHTSLTRHLRPEAWTKERNRDRCHISGGRRTPAIYLGSLVARCNGIGEVLTHRQGLFTQANSLVPNSSLIKHTADRSHSYDNEDPKNEHEKSV